MQWKGRFDLPDRIWYSSPSMENLKPDEIHIWHVNLNPLSSMGASSSLLSGPIPRDEQERAARFIKPTDRIHYITTRKALRSILSLYTRTPAHLLTFEYGPNRKPSLSQNHPGGPHSFNLSHSQDLAVIAVAMGSRRIGIDVEKIRELKHRSGILKWLFSNSELEEYEALPSDLQLQTFFQIWSRKEAFIKAWGETIMGTMKMKELDIALAPGAPAQIRSVPTGYEVSKNWKVMDIPIGNHYSCCLVAESTASDPELELQLFNFNKDFLASAI